MDLTPQEKILVNGWQRGFPLVPNPYAAIAEEMETGEQNVIAMLASLKDRGVLSRVGAIVRPNSVGASSLVAMRIPPAELEEIAAIVDQEPSVNHNYERENELNLWFVVTASSPADLDAVLSRLEEKTGYQTIKLPLEKAYHIDLGFKI